MGFIQDRLVPLDNTPRSYFYYHNVFNDDLLNSLEIPSKLSAITDSKEGYENLELNRIGCSLPLNEKSNKFYENLFFYLSKANKNYKFDIDFFDDVYYFEYGKSNKGLEWHMDVANGIEFNRRKISFSIFLNDRSEYKGGELEVWQDPKEVTIPISKGSIVFFPSYLLHRITPITEGIRKVIVGFVGGTPFK